MSLTAGRADHHLSLAQGTVTTPADGREEDFLFFREGYAECLGQRFSQGRVAVLPAADSRNIYAGGFRGFAETVAVPAGV
jgi:hypothetical protein